MELTTSLTLAMSPCAFLASAALLFKQVGLAQKLRGYICVVLGIYLFAFTLLANDVGSLWHFSGMELLGIWPLLPALIAHLALEEYASREKVPESFARHHLYIPAFIFVAINFIWPNAAQQFSHNFSFFSIGHILTGIQFTWLISFHCLVFLMIYRSRKKVAKSLLFSDMMLWYLPILLLLVSQFTVPPNLHDKMELLWLPAIIPIGSGLYRALSLHFKFSIFRNKQGSYPSQILIRTDIQGIILTTDSYTDLHLGNQEKKVNRQHVSCILPAIRIRANSFSKLTYMKGKGKKGKPVIINIDALPERRGFLIKGSFVD